MWILYNKKHTSWMLRNWWRAEDAGPVSRGFGTPQWYGTPGTILPVILYPQGYHITTPSPWPRVPYHRWFGTHRGTISPCRHRDLGYHITGDLMPPRGTISTRPHRGDLLPWCVCTISLNAGCRLIAPSVLYLQFVPQEYIRESVDLYSLWRRHGHAHETAQNSRTLQL